jgi:hypothetical protein
VKAVFARYAKLDDFDRVIEQFLGNITFPASDDLSADEFVANMKAIKPLAQSASGLAKQMELDGGDSAILAAIGEFLLEGLYVNDRLSKKTAKGKTFFRK